MHLYNLEIITITKLKRLSITNHPNIVKWLKENTGSVVDNKPFRSTSDLIEQAILLLKEKVELDK